MRPVLLELEGFGAFRERTTVDFADTDVFAFVGPTGSGKSTVIDAICFALYGNVPRYADARLVAPAVSLGALEAKVRLTFELGGARYVAARVVRRNKDKVTTKEARLERVSEPAAVLAGTAKELGVEVERLLGLPFAHFTRCVVLPQGEFARFLHDLPSERQDLLVRLLDLGVYEQMAQLANREGREHELRAEVAGQQLAALTPHDDAALAAAEARASQLAELSGALVSAEPELQQLERAAETAEAGRAAAVATLTALRAVHVPEALRERTRLVTEAVAALEAAELQHEQASDALGRAEADAADAGDPEAIDRLLAVHQRIERGVVKQHEVAAALAAAIEAEGAASRAEAAAEDSGARARLGLEVAQREHAAHALRGHLAAGEPCPVCEQLVVTLAPAGEAPPALGRAEAEAREALDAASSARRATQAAAEGRARVEQDLAAVEKLLAELQAEVAEHARAEVLAARSVAARAAAARLEAARAAEAAARRVLAQTRSARAGLDAGSDEAERTYHAQRDPLVGVGAPAPGRDLLASWAELLAWAAGRVPVSEAEQAARAAAAGAARAEHRRRLDALRAAAAAAEVPAGAPLAAVVHRAEAEADQAIVRIRQVRQQATALEAAVREARAEGEVARALAQLLSARGFPRWLVADAMAALVDRAAMTLRELSGGQYSLAADAGGELWVVDHRNADERRPVRTLSGGETFQASLALALALADELGGRRAGAAAPLDAIFLDEGFGTLDAESLDAVASTIEAIGGSGRMVGLVTHVPALAQRVPVRYVVTKGPATATVVREVG